MIPAAADLYSLPIGEFTAERDRLARRLADEGSKEDAVAVSRLRKPTTDAWALNQVARTRPELIEQLVGVHEELRRAADRDVLRNASERRVRLLEEITAAAASALAEAGHSASGGVLDRIGRTLLAAGGDESTERLLQAGTLTQAAEIAGGWPGEWTAPVSAAERSAPDPERSRELQRLHERADEAARRAEDLRAEARQARQVLEEARRRLDAAVAAAKEAEREAREAQRAWDEARRAGG